MVLVRDFKESDRNFICSSFINSTYHNSIDASTKLCNKLNWSVGMNRTINNILSTFDCKIAYQDDDPNFIIGYIIYKNNMLCYVYVKENFRKHSISKLLMNELPKNTFIQTLFTSKQMNSITKQLTNWDYSPFI